MKYKIGFSSVVLLIYFLVLMGVSVAAEENRPQHNKSRDQHLQQKNHQPQMRERPEPQRNDGQIRNDNNRDRRNTPGERHQNFRPYQENERFSRNHRDHMRGYVTHERYNSWHYRHRNFYNIYYRRPYVVYYDMINPYWFFWLTDHPKYFAVWVYNHRYEIDVLRYEALLRENYYLAEQLREMEQRGVPVDENYCPPNVDEDLQYSQEYIEKYRR